MRWSASSRRCSRPAGSRFRQEARGTPNDSAGCGRRRARTSRPRRSRRTTRRAPVASSGRWSGRGARALWRCEIKWHVGYVNSSFRAVAHGPKRLRGVTVGHSDVYKWGLLKGDPEVSDTKYHADVWSLANRLTAAGWEPAGRGRSWYETALRVAAGGARRRSGLRSCARGGRPMTARVARAGFLWAGAAAAGGATVGVRGGDDASHASPSESWTASPEPSSWLEQVQEAFYREALDSAELDGDLLKFASRVATAGEQARRVPHAAAGRPAQDPPRSNFGAAMSSAERFRDAAIQLEEAALATYVGQAPRLTPRRSRAVGTLVSVEARQVAWIRDLAGMSPAPHAADPASKADDVLADLRVKGFIA